MLTAKPLRRLAAVPRDREKPVPRLATLLTDRHWHRWRHWIVSSPRRAYLVTLVSSGAVGGLIAPLAMPVAALYGAFGLTAYRRDLHRRRVDRLREDIVHRLELLVGDVKSGIAPAGALARLAEVCRTRGGDHADPATGRLGDRLAALSTVVEHTGAPAAELLERLVVDLRASRHTEATLAANTAGTRVSMRMLAVLPVLGPFLGAAVGADALTVLFDTPIGITCLIAAMALQGAGVWWSTRIRRSAQRQVSTP